MGLLAGRCDCYVGLLATRKKPPRKLETGFFWSADVLNSAALLFVLMVINMRAKIFRDVHAFAAYKAVEINVNSKQYANSFVAEIINEDAWSLQGSQKLGKANWR